MFIHPRFQVNDLPRKFTEARSEWLLQEIGDLRGKGVRRRRWRVPVLGDQILHGAVERGRRQQIRGWHLMVLVRQQLHRLLGADVERTHVEIETRRYRTL